MPRIALSSKVISVDLCDPADATHHEAVRLDTDGTVENATLCYVRSQGGLTLGQQFEAMGMTWKTVTRIDRPDQQGWRAEIADAVQ